MTEWQVLDVAGTTGIEDLAVGDFDGDKVPDVFRADGSDRALRLRTHRRYRRVELA